MKKICFLIMTISGGFASAQNLQLRAHLSFGNTALANISGYVDSLGNEYALVGTDAGMSIVDVSNPDTPVIRFNVPGPSSEWREIKTYRKYAYVTTEGGGGLTIVNLSLLPASINYKQYTGDGAITGQLDAIHALHCDTATGFLYLYGCDIGSGNSRFLNLADPWNPTYAGQYLYPGGGTDAYVHDGYVLNDTMYEGHIYPGFFTVVDVRNKSNPVLLAEQFTPGLFTHNTWLSDDHHILFTTDEISNSFLTAYDISNLHNITELSRFQTAPGSGADVHNTHILHDFAVTSWYREGVVITDISHPTNPVEVGHYDTYTQGSGNGMDGCWGVYPYLPSGTIVASDITNGLFVFTPTYVHACYLLGHVTDSVTGAFINSAKIQILGSPNSRLTNPSGYYETGILDSGTYDVRITVAGYYHKIISGISLSNGITDTLDIQLVPIPTFTFTGTVVDSMTGMPIPGVQLSFSDSEYQYMEMSNAAGQFTVPGMITRPLELKVGKWGYMPVCSSHTPDAAFPLLIKLLPGYYDDFSFDLGWSVSGTSANLWQRGEPVGTYYPTTHVTVNPEYDVTTDCNEECYVTDNGGGSSGAHDVDNGKTILTSPVFDATIFSNPTVEYDRWFINLNSSTSTANDTMRIKLTDGISTVTLENVLHTSTGNGTWVHSSFPVASFIPVSSTMRLLVQVADVAPNHTTEGALDQFFISGQLLLGLNSTAEHELTLQAFPNPFTKEISFTFPDHDLFAQTLEIRNLLGQLVEKHTISEQTTGIKAGIQLQPGIYLASLKSEGMRSSVIRIVKL